METLGVAIDTLDTPVTSPMGRELLSLLCNSKNIIECFLFFKNKNNNIINLLIETR